MSIKASYSNEEWEILSALPSQAAIAASVSDGVTLIGTIRELREGLEALEAGASAYPGNELIAAILTEMADQTEAAADAERMVAEGGASPPAAEDLDDLPIEATQPRAETNSDFTEAVVTTSAPADAVAAMEIPEVDPRDPNGFVHEVIANATQVRELLAAKATPEEAAAYRDWVNGVVDRVIKRSKSGGFLGIGGERIGDDEERFQTELAAALGG